MTPAEVQVFADDDPNIERILDLIDEAARPRPLVEVLGALCTEVAEVLSADVASIYVRAEPPDDGSLVMQANVGFPGRAIGKVRLRVGEGITGFAAECLRPVMVTKAPSDTHYKSVPGLGEEDYPIFLALPVLVGRRAEAVLVLQRKQEKFERPEVVLASALTTVFAYALERARVAAESAREAEPETPRTAHLTGRALSAGVALGRVETAPAFDGLAALARARGLADEADAEVRFALLQRALEATCRDLSRAHQSVAERLDDAASAQVQTLLLAGQDRRFLECLEARSQAEENPALVLRDVARTYARAPYQMDKAVDQSITARTSELETLCLQVALRLLDERTPSQGAALLLADRLPALLALTAINRRVSAVAIGGPESAKSLGVQIAQAAGLPVVAHVGGLYAWARSGDRILVDGDEGVVHVNPSATRVARVRRG